jgi:hypothetical protein
MQLRLPVQGEKFDLKEVAQKLDVAHVPEGSVRKAGNQVRITAQLIKADDGYHMWSETYDRSPDNIFAIQDEISAAVVASLKIELLGEALERLDAFIKEHQSWAAKPIASIYSWMGDIDMAFEWLDRAYRQRDSEMGTLLGDPLFIFTTRRPALD